MVLRFVGLVIKVLKIMKRIMYHCFMQLLILILVVNDIVRGCSVYWLLILLFILAIFLELWTRGCICLP